MSDIVERLRDLSRAMVKADMDMSLPPGSIDPAEAADTITRLRAEAEKWEETARASEKRVAYAQAENERLRAALSEISVQKKSTELVTATDVEYADFEDGYDMCIDCARVALSGDKHE